MSPRGKSCTRHGLIGAPRPLPLPPPLPPPPPPPPQLPPPLPGCRCCPSWSDVEAHRYSGGLMQQQPMARAHLPVAGAVLAAAAAAAPWGA